MTIFDWKVVVMSVLAIAGREATRPIPMSAVLIVFIVCVLHGPEVGKRMLAARDCAKRETPPGGGCRKTNGAPRTPAVSARAARDRKSVVEGTRGAGRLGVGGRRH